VSSNPNDISKGAKALTRVRDRVLEKTLKGIRENKQVTLSHNILDVETVEEGGAVGFMGTVLHVHDRTETRDILRVRLSIQMTDDEGAKEAEKAGLKTFLVGDEHVIYCGISYEFWVIGAGWIGVTFERWNTELRKISTGR
jgi:hypothetical protein